MQKPSLDQFSRVTFSYRFPDHISGAFHGDVQGGDKYLGAFQNRGIDYLDPAANPIPDFHGFFQLFHDHLHLPGKVCRHFELGRSLTGQCGSLITRVLYVKQGNEKIHVIVDAGMTELIRPALYGAIHKIENITSSAGSKIFDVVGPICESSDCFGKDVMLPETLRGDLLKIHSCGAYGESMAMNYNLRGEIGKVYLEAKQFTLHSYLSSSFTASSIC